MSTLNHYTEPQIINFNTLSKHAYIEFYLNGKRIRIANGDTLLQRIKPNRCQSIEERNQLLSKLHFELKKALESGKYPVKQTPEAKIPQPTFVDNPVETISQSAIQLLFKAVRSKLRDDLSKKYKRNLKSVYRQFKKFATEDELNSSITSISTTRIESFLLQFNKSGTYYMNKRRDLGVLFSAAGRLIDQSVEVIQKSKKKKSKAKLHKAYERDQLKPILSYLKAHNPNLYICSLLTYGAWLRPHEEVRLLTVGNFKNDLSEVHLSGEENKGGRVRVVHIPEYIRVELRDKLDGLGRHDNIFSLNEVPFNEYYFNTQWSRAWAKMYKLGLIFEDQTIYSFRHTAAVQLYRRTKDVHLLQQLLGHSAITVTLKYLRNLGEINSEELAKYAPQLEF
ncbi:Integrase [Mucilaginibacter gossypiicola]|uniref:Integrase n=1 Tax=Mucilaginibacter gossypiicola TaxID=551995 RepID=A0A1H8M349_9SPHI|nr:Integrase [Mucilaginibacter gossypiicola]